MVCNSFQFGMDSLLLFIPSTISILNRFDTLCIQDSGSLPHALKENCP